MKKDAFLAAAALLALVASAAAQAVTTTTAYKEGLKGSVTGKNDCPAGYAAITSAADCVVAGQALGIKNKEGLDHTTAKTYESARYPTGCLHDTNVYYPNTLLFNPLPGKGRFSGNPSLICKADPPTAGAPACERQRGKCDVSDVYPNGPNEASLEATVYKAGMDTATMTMAECKASCDADSTCTHASMDTGVAAGGVCKGNPICDHCFLFTQCPKLQKGKEMYSLYAKDGKQIGKADCLLAVTPTTAPAPPPTTTTLAGAPACEHQRGICDVSYVYPNGPNEASLWATVYKAGMDTATMTMAECKASCDADSTCTHASMHTGVAAGGICENQITQVATNVWGTENICDHCFLFTQCPTMMASSFGGFNPNQPTTYAKDGKKNSNDDDGGESRLPARGHANHRTRAPSNNNDTRWCPSL
jgi:hypothetical protein